MRYRGLDPRTRPLRWAVFLAAIVVVLAATGGGALDAVRTWVTAEQERIPWYATRLLGLLAYLVLAGSVIYGLLLSTGILDAFAHRTVSFTLHQDLSAIGLGLALVHAAMLTLDHSVPFTIAELLLPFTGPPAAVGRPRAAVAGAHHRRHRELLAAQAHRPKRWRTLHYVTFLAFLGARHMASWRAPTRAPRGPSGATCC